jgi:hypothetical protein
MRKNLGSAVEAILALMNDPAAKDSKIVRAFFFSIVHASTRVSNVCGLVVPESRIHGSVPTVGNALEDRSYWQSWFCYDNRNALEDTTSLYTA